MEFVQFKLWRDKTQTNCVSINLALLAAMVEIDQKRTELVMLGKSIIVHGSYDEVLAKINAVLS